MVLVIPSIEMINGLCNDCITGEKQMESHYKQLTKNPYQLAKLWRRENAKSIYIKDMDSFSKNNYSEMNIIATLFIAQSLDIPIVYHSDFDSVEKCKFALDNGIYRIIINDLPLKNKEGVANLIRKYSSSRVIFNLTEKDGLIKNQMGISISRFEYLKTLNSINASRIFYLNDDWEENLTKENFDELIELATDSNLKITLSNGICDSQNLWHLNELSHLGIDSVVLGKALYNNQFPCQKIWRLIEAELEPTQLQFN